MAKYNDEQALAKAYMRANHNDDFIGNPRLILNWLGIQLLHNPLEQPHNEYGRLTITNSNATLELFTKNNPYEFRQNAVIGHAIANYCLHSDDQHIFISDRKSMDRQTNYWNRRETAAIDFYGKLLMPTNRLYNTMVALKNSDPFPSDDEINEILMKEYRLPGSVVSERYQRFVKNFDMIEKQATQHETDDASVMAPR